MSDAALLKRCQDNALQAIARESAACLIEQMIEQKPWRDQMWARGALMIAARAIRRGRHLSNAEKSDNLALAFEQEGDHEIAAKIRRLIPLEK